MSHILVAIAEEEYTNYYLLPEHVQTPELISKLDSATTGPNIDLAEEIMEEISEHRFRFWFGESPPGVITKPVHKMYFFSCFE